MQFKIISIKILTECISNWFTTQNGTFEQFNKFAKLQMSEEQFNRFKVKGISANDIRKLISNTSINEKDEIERIAVCWNNSEKLILSKIKKLTGLTIETGNISCYVDPYQNGGYYGVDNITVGAYKNPEDILFVITHELFHIFYWKEMHKLNITNSTLGTEPRFEWLLAEATVAFVLADPEMLQFWVAGSAEPDIELACNKIKKYWTTSDFENYLKKSYELLQHDTQ